MNRRTIIFITLLLLAAILITAGYLYFFKISKMSEETNTKEPIIEKDWFSAVPIDAVAIGCFSDIKDLEEMFLNENSFFKSYVDVRSDIFSFMQSVFLENREGNLAPVISVHYSAKNDLSLLFSVQTDDVHFLEKLLKKHNGELNVRNFSGAVLYESPEIAFTYFGGFFICSSSKILLESSVRHLASSTSILDNKDFKKVLENYLHLKNLFILNNQQSGKLFSGLFSENMLSYSDFIMNFGSWIVLEGFSVKNGSVEFNGEIINLKGFGSFSSILKDVKPAEFEAPEILPYNTIALLSIACDDFEQYFVNEHKYLSYYKKLDSLEFVTQKDLFLKHNKREIVSALIHLKSGNEWITLVRAQNKRNLKDETAQSSLATLFGSVFTLGGGDKTFNMGSWSVTGSEEALNFVLNANQSDSTLKLFMKKEKLSSTIMKSGAILTAIINNSPENDFLPFIFNKRVGASIYGKRVAGKERESALLQIFPKGDALEITLTFISRK